MAKTGQVILRCAYPGCENEPRPGEAGTAAEPGYCGLPDPVTGEPHTALTAFRRRQVLARQGGGAAGPEDLGRRPGFAVWRHRGGAQRRQRAEAEAGEARLAALQADAQLAEALAAKAAAEQEAVAAREAAQARVAQAEREAEERVAAAQQERDEAVAGAESRAGQAESRAREVAGSARAELDRARQDAGRQVAQVREDAARDQAGLRAALEARIAAAAEARAGFQARAEHAEAELQRARADRDQAAGQATPRQPGDATRRRRRPGGR